MSIKVLVQATTFPKTYLKTDQILIIEQKLRGKMDFRAPIERKIQGGMWWHTTSFSWSKVESLASEGKKRHRGESVNDCPELLCKK